jgi:putative transcriptional regulator
VLKLHDNLFRLSDEGKQMTSDTFTSLKGHFLMAMPSLADPNFRHSVTCISEHTPDGAVGIVISQVYPHINAKMIFDELGIECREHASLISIHKGGPVHADELFILHSQPSAWNGHLMVTEALALGNSRSILEAIAMDQGPKAFLIALGCAGWGPGQLEWEMMQNAWLTLPCCQDIIFDLPVEERWESAMKRLGIDPDLIVETAGNA